MTRPTMTVAADREAALLAQMLGNVTTSATHEFGSGSTLIEPFSPTAAKASAITSQVYNPIVQLHAPVVELVKDHLGKAVAEVESDDAFAVADVGSVIRQHRQWVDALPM
ncbi:hypothetical protein BC828DRAFT_409188, partial [Blastocladiella britannica]